MRDGERGAVRELRPDDLLDDVVSLRVHIGRRFVNQQNFRFPCKIFKQKNYFLRFSS